MHGGDIMYKVIYFNDLNLVTDKDFDTEAEARTFLATVDWGRLVTLTASRTITDITTPTP